MMCSYKICPGKMESVTKEFHFCKYSLLILKKCCELNRIGVNKKIRSFEASLNASGWLVKLKNCIGTYYAKIDLKYIPLICPIY
jgi:hypothetical protein